MGSILRGDTNYIRHILIGNYASTDVRLGFSRFCLAHFWNRQPRNSNLVNTTHRADTFCWAEKVAKSNLATKTASRDKIRR